MYTNIENLDIVISLLKQHNIRHIVISPGGTNQRLIWKIQEDSFFKCYSVVDERSAMYFAIGLYLQTGEIISTCCTSAQATRNYIPGLTEAFYKHTPILAITMSKHPRFTYQEYMQAPDQTSLPKDSVKASFCLPYLEDENDFLHSQRVVNEAILELTHGNPGPVQLNIPWLDFKLDSEIHEVRTMQRLDMFTPWKLNLTNEKILIVVGEHLPFNENTQKAIECFCDKFNAVVYVNNLSNYHGKYTIKANLQMTTIKYEVFQNIYRPDIIISIGGQTGDYPLYHQLSKISLKGVEHWRVSQDGAIVDTYDKLTKVFECTEEYFFNSFNTNIKNEHTYYDIWKSLLDKANINVDIPFSNTYAAQVLHSLIPHNSYIQFSILNSLRTWNLFQFHHSIKCFSNVAAFGIDGGMSTLLGISMNTDQLCFMVIGDLAFLYDMNSLSIRDLKNNVRILLINNNGGIEFKLHGEDRVLQNKYVAAADSFKNAQGWAESCGFCYMSANCKEEFNTKCKSFVQPSKKSIVFEIFVSDIDESSAYRKLLDTNTDITEIDMIKRNIKKGIKTLLAKK